MNRLAVSTLGVDLGIASAQPQTQADPLEVLAMGALAKPVARDTRLWLESRM